MSDAAPHIIIVLPPRSQQLSSDARARKSSRRVLLTVANKAQRRGARLKSEFYTWLYEHELQLVDVVSTLQILAGRRVTRNQLADALNCHWTHSRCKEEVRAAVRLLIGAPTTASLSAESPDVIAGIIRMINCYHTAEIENAA